MMGHPSTLYRFRIDLSDVDRGVYDALDFRVAMHPSETTDYLITRVLAFALSVEEGLEFSSGGLSEPDEPCLRSLEPGGAVRLWIEIGNPSARKLHKASKASKRVKVFTYKDPEALLREMDATKVHRAAEIEIYSFKAKFLAAVAETLQKDNKWNLVQTEGTLSLSIGSRSEQAEVTRHHAQA